MPVQADAVDSTNIGPVASFLPPGPNVVAQALISDPTIRSFRAEHLAKLLHVSVSDARAGIASIIGMINAIAMGNPKSALTENVSLSHAVGPFMSLDQAMSRFGSHMGPIVVSPEPRPGPYYQGDFPPDREYGAGRMHFYGEAGDLSNNMASATQAMLDYLHFHGCGPDATIGDFQDTFNSEFAPPTPLAVDNKYGSLTRTALLHVIASAPASSDLASAAAPAACHYQTSPGPGTYTVPATTVTPTAPISQVTPAPATHPVAMAGAATGGIFDSPWTWALILAAAAAATISQSKHPPKWARKMGLHR